MKSLKWLLIVSFLLFPFANFTGASVAAAQGTAETLQLSIGSTVMKHNGQTYKSSQPVTVVNGASFIPFSSIAKRYGYTISYDAKRKESIATGSAGVLRFKIGSVYAYRGGTPVKLTGKPYILNGSLMVPLRSWGVLTESAIKVVGKQITLSWTSVVVPKKPKAFFEVKPDEIYAGQTPVTYVDRSVNFTDAPYVDERWEGRMDVFPEAGVYTVTRQVQDINGLWSDPFSVTVVVKPPNQAPVAEFSTAKSSYRIGENVTYIDQSSDDENGIVRRTWSGNDDVFFEAGEHLVTLEVQDRHGLIHSVTKPVVVTSEVLYTRDEYNKLFTKPGDKFSIDSASVLTIPALPYTIHSESSQMVRSNSPETLLQEGIVYQTQMTGKIRFMFHNVNNIGYPVKMHLLATNRNGTPVNVSTSSMGLGGPDKYVVNTGKLSTVRYLKSLDSNPAPRWTTIRPHETKEILPELSKTPMKLMEVLTAYADIYTEQELEFYIVVVAAGKNPIAELPNLSILPRDGKHVRGTFYNSDRTIELFDTLGETPQRIMLGDKKMDSYLDGIDDTSGQLEYNIGNFGVLYRLRLPHVAPNTLIALNARGGYYTGAFMVNGQVVTVANASILKDNKEAAVLYRTGNAEEPVEIVFTLAAGSNLPVAMLFLPLPRIRW
ncbi:copper amine oxidase N-terminal domain-containing protein [Paenibacillus montanisoli]|uniref:Copper amine oxidase N-terminal domain-containing protein n=1 Tax=Paenibacillus montanisoli TaxID=2081970 RepID=A0A328U397_9BACL|nr:copper amine oxidase N-terminal domain-containing protein [Paenibacillus montanisoli]RAP76512.1 copper amine oxidase N-terminal domain-containing protein [Paenibacillus montanisoli]